MERSHQSDDLKALAALTEPIRRALYDYVAESAEPVSRDDAAVAVGVSRQVAAYHLDRLADEGLLEVEYRRLTGLTGPGAGRPAKLYLRSDRTYQVSLPARRYELAARILLEAVGSGDLDSSVLTGIAHRIGVEIGKAGLAQGLQATGYEPSVEGAETRFRNCPFHVLREQDRDTTCSLNLALVRGIVEGSGAEVEACLQPEPGYCCVRLRPAEPRT